VRARDAVFKMRRANFGRQNQRSKEKFVRTGEEDKQLVLDLIH
jgi:hypothetical protein